MLWECGIDEPAKIDPLLIVARLGIVMVYGPLDGPTAHIFRHGDRAIMRVSDAIVHVGRRNFTIGHEVGHYVLDHQIATAREHEAARTPYQEREADVFAAELLMPELMVTPYVDKAASFATVREIGETFRTSLVASARRYVELSTKPCALVYSKDGRAEWAKHSRSFPARIPQEIRIGRGTIASDAAANTNVISETERVVPTSAWFARGNAPKNCRSMVEHAATVSEPGWGGVLSLLSIA